MKKVIGIVAISTLIAVGVGILLKKKIDMEK